MARTVTTIMRHIAVARPSAQHPLQPSAPRSPWLPNGSAAGRTTAAVTSSVDVDTAGAATIWLASTGRALTGSVATAGVSCGSACPCDVGDPLIECIVTTPMMIVRIANAPAGR